ncbi:MAG: hypothetical protein U0525_04000 [Patescibacteria group bacterium]
MFKLSKLHNKTPSELAFLLINVVIGFTSLLLLFPVHSGLSIFAKSVLEAAVIILIIICLNSLGFYFFYRKLKPRNVKSIFIIFSTLSISAFFIAISIAFIWMRFEVISISQLAAREYSGNVGNSLLAMASDSSQPFINRNKAVYALGQIADKKSLPVLKSLSTGKIPEHESLYETLSQYELQKAIRWCEGGNATSWLYWDRGSW